MSVFEIRDNFYLNGKPVKIRYSFSEELLLEDTTESGGKTTRYVDLQKEA